MAAAAPATTAAAPAPEAAAPPAAPTGAAPAAGDAPGPELPAGGAIASEALGLSDPKIVKEGWMWKVGEHGMSWKHRYFVIYSDPPLFLYRKTSNAADEAIAAIELGPNSTCARDSVFGGAGEGYQLKVETEGRSWHFRTDEEDTLAEWVAAFRRAIGYSSMEDVTYMRLMLSEFATDTRGLRVAEDNLPDPPTGFARVRILAAGVSAHDKAVVAGTMKLPGAKLPFSPGMEFVGVVDAMGPGSIGLTEGQRVGSLCKLNGYAQYILMPTDKLVPLPDEVPIAKLGALTLNYVAAWQMLVRHGEIKAGQSILIHGATGGMGVAIAQLAAIATPPGGAPVRMYGTAAATKHEALTSLGVTPVDYTGDFEAKVKESEPEGVDIVFDHIGGDHYSRSAKCLKAGGRLIAFSTRGGFSSTKALASVKVSRGKSAISFNMLEVVDKHFDWYAMDLIELSKKVASGKLDPRVARTVGLNEIKTAHDMMTSRDHVGKILLDPWGGAPARRRGSVSQHMLGYKSSKSIRAKRGATLEATAESEAAGGGAAAGGAGGAGGAGV